MKKTNSALEYFVLLFSVLIISLSFAAPSQLLVTVCTSGCNYTSLEQAINAQEQDLVSADKYLDVLINEAFVDTTPVVIENYTTDATRYINIATDATARHDGIIEDGYIIAPGNGQTAILINQTANVKINGLSVKLTAPTYHNYAYGVRWANSVAGTLHLSDSIFYFSGSLGSYTTAKAVQQAYGNTTNCYIWNNIIIGMGQSGEVNHGQGIFFGATSGGGSHYIYNNTIIGGNSSTGIGARVGTNILKNNICYGNTVNDYSGTFNSTSTHNLSSDDTAPNTGTYYRSATVTFEDADNKNYHLDAADEGAIAKGIALSFDSTIPFNIDIDGTTRGGTWDLGAHQVAETDPKPLVVSFDVPSLYRGNLNVPVTEFTATTLAPRSVAAYLITESDVTPASDDAGWSSTAQTTFTTSTDGEVTLYAWVKDDEDNISLSVSDTVEIKLYSSLFKVWANGGEGTVRQDEIRSLDGDDVTNYFWDGTTIKLKEAKNGYATAAVIIEAGGDVSGGIDLEDISIEMTSLTGPNDSEITYGVRTSEQIFDFTLSDIEIFYARYLQVNGIVGIPAYPPKENSYAPQMQRPHTMTYTTPSWPFYPQNDHSGYEVAVATTGTTWSDRPGANKYFPDPLIPIELHPTFDVTAGESQMIWIDFFIPKDTEAGLHTGTLTIKEGETTLQEIPIELIVRDFTLPDQHYVKSWGLVEPTHVFGVVPGFAAYPNYSGASESEKQRLVNHWRNFQLMLHKHGMAYGNGSTSKAPTSFGTVPETTYIDWDRILSGELFTSEFGYNGPGIGMSQDFYAIGLYGHWCEGFVGGVSITFDGTQNDMTRPLGGWKFAHNGCDEYTSDGRTYVVEIDGTGTPDTYKWSMDGGETWEDENLPCILGKYNSGTGGWTGLKTKLVNSNIGGRAKNWDDPNIRLHADRTWPDPNIDADWTIGFGSTTGHTLGDSWTFTPYSKAEVIAQVQEAADDWYSFLQTNYPGLYTILGLQDEPSWYAELARAEEHAQWIDGCTGGGENLPTYVDLSLPYVYPNAPSADIVVASLALDTWDHYGYGTNPNEFKRGWKYYKDQWLDGSNPLAEIQVYNYGANENTVDRIVSGWSFYRGNIRVNFIYSIALWGNNEGAVFCGGEYTNTFKQAITLGGNNTCDTFSGTGLDDFLISNNWTHDDDSSIARSYVFEIDGTGTPDTFKWSADGGTTWVAEDIPILADEGVDVGNGLTDMSPRWRASTGHTLGDKWSVTIPADDSIYGQKLTAGNGAFVWFYPGTNVYYSRAGKEYPEDNYGVDGVFASRKLKLYRKSMQDADYLYMAAEINKDLVDKIANSLNSFEFNSQPKNWGGCGAYGNFMCGGASEASTNLAPIDDFARALDNLAEIIIDGDTAFPRGELKGNLTGFSF
jgi:hypothetical protein